MTMGLKVDLNILLAPLYAALAESLIKAFLKWIESWGNPAAELGAIDKVAIAVAAFASSDKTINTYVDLREKLNEIKSPV